jgi:hypothetical protein
MSLNLATAKAFVNAVDCINAEGASALAPHTVADALFTCQADGLKDVKTVGAYADWSQAFLKGNETAIFEGVLAEDTASNTVLWSAVVWPGGKEGPCLDYAYQLHFTGEGGKIDSMKKLWNDKFSLALLGM